MGTFYRLAACALLTISIASTTHATTAPAYELGETFPHAADQSLDARWHVYVFTREGVRYVQINDTMGHVHAAFANQDGDYLVLPIGEDTDRVMVPTNALVDKQSQAPCGRSCTTGVMAPGPVQNNIGNVIYQDATLQITLTENAQAQPVWTVTGQPVAQH